MKASDGAMAMVGATVAGDMIAMWNGSHDENMTSELLSLSKLALMIRGDM